MHILPVSLLNTALRRVEKPAFRRATDVVAFRKRFERQAKLLFKTPPLTTYLPDVLRYQDRSVPAQWASCAVTQPGVILYFHGGAYSIGAPVTHRAMLARLSEMTGLQAVLPDYRMAPEDVFPAAVEDAETTYRALLGRGYRPEQIVLGGDSAGGGLMFALLHRICSSSLPEPAAAFAFSPWTDLTLSGESLTANASIEALLPAEMIAGQRDIYLDGASPETPEASPIFGTFKNAPPVLIQVGDRELLLDDSRMMTAALKRQGVDIEIEIWPRTPHVWQIFQGWLKEADTALNRVAGFVSSNVSRDS